MLPLFNNADSYTKYVQGDMISDITFLKCLLLFKIFLALKFISKLQLSGSDIPVMRWNNKKTSNTKVPVTFRQD